jgi:hypothetical protein
MQYPPSQPKEIAMTPYESTDERIIREAADRYRHGPSITDLQARVVASAWHGGQSSALYSLASTGAIRTDLGDEIRACIGHVPMQDGMSTDEAALHALRLYVENIGERGYVAGWSDLRW